MRKPSSSHRLPQGPEWFAQAASRMSTSKSNPGALILYTAIILALMGYIKCKLVSLVACITLLAFRTGAPNNNLPHSTIMFRSWAMDSSFPYHIYPPLSLRLQSHYTYPPPLQPHTSFTENFNHVKGKNSFGETSLIKNLIKAEADQSLKGLWLHGLIM